MKKILAIATALMLAISSLCVFVVADATTVEIDGTTYEVLFSEDVSIASGNWTGFSLSDSSSLVTAMQTEGAYLVITRSSGVTLTGDNDYDNLLFQNSWYSGTAYVIDMLTPEIGDSTVIGFSANTVYNGWVSGGNSTDGTPYFISNTSFSYTITNVSVVVAEDSGSTVSGSTFTVNGADLGSSNYNGSYDSATQTLSYTASYGCCGWWFGSGSTYNLESFTVTLTENDDSEWWQVVVEYVDGSSSTANGTSTELTVTCDDACIKQIYIQNGSSADQTITVSAVSAVERTSTSTDDPTVTVVRTNDFIYVNEEYHALLVYRNNRRYFVCVPHTVASNGYCTVCHMYIGTDDEETASTTIDGVEYEEAYSADVNLASSGWGTYEFEDNSIIDALATDGALLVITRSEATDIVYDDEAGTYEKLGLVDSWWSGDWLRLGTAGHTDADEEAETIIDCMSDDGTTIIYDGATVYAAWAAAGMNDGGIATLVTNTSGTYTITNVAVYVPAGTVTTEDVSVDEPAEEGDTDDEEDMNVDDGDEAEAEAPAETNPTTGVALALVPMAIAGLAVVASKRK